MWARIQNGIVAEIISNNPEGLYHPSLEWVSCDSSVQVGYLYDGSAFTAPSAPTPQPNSAGFISALKTLWGIVECNTLSTAYPLFFAAISDNDWPNLQILILDAQSKNIINSTQYAAIKSAALANNIPVTL